MFGEEGYLAGLRPSRCMKTEENLFDRLLAFSDCTNAYAPHSRKGKQQSEHTPL